MVLLEHLFHIVLHILINLRKQRMNAINVLCKDLKLPKGDSYTQDWVYELPEEYRTEEWLDKYIVAYSNSNYSEQEKNLLMSLMLDIINDFLIEKSERQSVLIDKVLKLLLANYQQHRQLIEYWSLDNEPLEDCFELTPKIRKITKKNRMQSLK